MNYYIANTDTLEKVIDLKVNSISTMDYIKLTNQYFQLITGEYILLHEGKSPIPNSEKNTYWGLLVYGDDECVDEAVGCWGY